MPPTNRRILLRALGGAGGIGLMIAIADASGMKLAAVPFATSIVLVLGAPGTPPAQPRRVAGGHMISAAAGLLCTALFGTEPWVAALGVGLAMAGMLRFDMMHPPAGINPLVIQQTQAGLSYLVSPVAAGVALLLLYSWIFYHVSGDGPEDTGT